MPSGGQCSPAFLMNEHLSRRRRAPCIARIERLSGRRGLVRHCDAAAVAHAALSGTLVGRGETPVGEREQGSPTLLLQQ
jgi:hypothetical protein